MSPQFFYLLCISLLSIVKLQLCRRLLVVCIMANSRWTVALSYFSSLGRLLAKASPFLTSCQHCRPYLLTNKWFDFKGSPIFKLTSIEVRSWSGSLGSQPAGDTVTNQAVGCRYFPPSLRSPSQPESITAFWPVPNYTAWWQRHNHVCMYVNNLSRYLVAGRPGIVLTTFRLLIRYPNHYTTKPCSIMSSSF